MATNTATRNDAFLPIGGSVTIPVRDLAPWAALAIILAMILLYFASTEQGATALFKGMYVHEYVHDGRHLLGFPCH